MEQRERIRHLFFVARQGNEQVWVEVGGTRQRGGVEVSMQYPDGWQGELVPQSPRSEGGGKQRKFRGRRV